jgi:hypothetical protein
MAATVPEKRMYTFVALTLHALQRVQGVSNERVRALQPFGRRVLTEGG